ncbi:hypothetical protein Y1Q_0023043 [Alligator mississippiensis]|uniref:Uncharacterized protein n=1 Tax=Alligator mississippiensis TaxID=8496 RepID=A0A151P7J7_ALLMI|nr:hypothetical protein Y1Q_0023043 [Alligator mississippiensis]
MSQIRLMEQLYLVCWATSKPLEVVEVWSAAEFGAYLLLAMATDVGTLEHYIGRVTYLILPIRLKKEKKEDAKGSFRLNVP